MLCRHCWRYTPPPGKNYRQIIAGSRNLSTDQIEEARYLLSLGLSERFVAAQLEVSSSTIWRIGRDSGLVAERTLARGERLVETMEYRS
jgi:hypothetical protein